jgi:hypothetical protein
MDSQYDLFERFPDHTLRWRSCVRGTERALEALLEMGQQTVNECFASDLDTNEILARVNEGPQILDDDSTAN